MTDISPNHWIVFNYENIYDINTRKETTTCCIIDLFLLYYIPMFVISLIYYDILLLPIVIINGLNIVRALLIMINYFERYKTTVVTIVINVLCAINVCFSIAYFVFAIFRLVASFEHSIVSVLVIIQLVWIYIKYTWCIVILINKCFRRYVVTPKIEERKLNRTRIVHDNTWADKVQYSTVTIGVHQQTDVKQPVSVVHQHA